MKRQREAWVDAAKGIAILFVVLGHVVSSYHNSGLLKDATVFGFVYTFVYSFHMPLFFVLSGYLAAKAPAGGSALQRIGYKVLSLGVPYVVFSVVTWGVKFILSSLSNTAVGIKELLAIAVFPINHMWYIYALMIMAVLHILLRKPLEGLRGRAVAMTVALVLRLLFKWTGWLSDWNLMDSVVEHLTSHLFWYFAGVFCAGWFQYRKPATRWSIPAAVAVLLYGALLWLLGDAQRRQPIVSTLLNGTGVVLFAFIAMYLEKSRLLTYLGKNSLPIYLLHGLVISASRILLTKLQVPLLFGATPMVVCGLLGIVLPLLCYWVCSKIRILDFCFYPGKYLKKRNS